MKSFTFSHAITRKPSGSIVAGLRAVDTGTPDLGLMLAHHADYIVALRSTGATVVELDAAEAFPDSVFVEDTALCLPKGAVVMRPGAPPPPGGGGPGFWVAVRAQPKGGGGANLARLIAPWGHDVREVFTPPGVLHFKTDCSLLDAETILSTRRLDASGCFAGYRVIHVADGEEACANTIRFNDLVIMPAGFPRTRDLLVQAGYKVQEIGNSECAKLDGGMSCLSLRFTPKP